MRLMPRGPDGEIKGNENIVEWSWELLEAFPDAKIIRRQLSVA
jgi:hypothetical protein